MIVENVNIYTCDHTFRRGSILIRDGRFAEIRLDGEKRISRENRFHNEKENRNSIAHGYDTEERIDGRGSYAVPGLIDMHFHGALGYDVCDATEEAFQKIAAYEASVGVTGICPATLTLPVEELCEVLRTGADYRRDAGKRKAKYAGQATAKRKTEYAGRATAKRKTEYAGQADTDTEVEKSSSGVVDGGTEAEADLLGFNMEGPFISPKKKGAQNEEYILPCSVEIAEKFLAASGGLVKYIGLAPEESLDFEDYIRQMKGRVGISLAHTNSDYDTAKRAFCAGASHAVHLYNAMTPFTHREPGVVGAVQDSGHVTAELICDGIHVHPAAVRAAFRMIGEERIVFISDSLRMTGLSDGEGILGGLPIVKKGPYCRLKKDGNLAGSVTNLTECMRNAVKTMDIPLETAVRCASENPAKRIGVYDEYGSIEVGKRADLVLLGSDSELEVKRVIKDGKVIRADQE